MTRGADGRWRRLSGAALAGVLLLAAGACGPNDDEGVVAGRVVNAAGHAVEGAPIAVLQDGRPAAVPGQKDAEVSGVDGRFEVRLPAGRYELRATAPDGSTTDAVPVEVEGGGQTNAVLRFAGDVPTGIGGTVPCPKPRTSPPTTDDRTGADAGESSAVRSCD